VAGGVCALSAPCTAAPGELGRATLSQLDQCALSPRHCFACTSGCFVYVRSATDSKCVLHPTRQHPGQPLTRVHPRRGPAAPRTAGHEQGLRQNLARLAMQADGISPDPSMAANTGSPHSMPATPQLARPDGAPGGAAICLSPGQPGVGHRERTAGSRAAELAALLEASEARAGAVAAALVQRRADSPAGTPVGTPRYRHSDVERVCQDGAHLLKVRRAAPSVYLSPGSHVTVPALRGRSNDSRRE
jgi:hypothetical protein